MSDAKRPILITLIAVIQLLVALLFIVLGAALCLDLIVVTDLDPDMQGLLEGGGIVSIVFGLIMMVVSAGFFKGWRLWWYIGVILWILELILDLISVVLGGFAMIVPLIIAIIVLWYLFRPGVKAFFKV